MVINIFSGGGDGAGEPRAGGCVTHLLRYDTAGRYVGERQSSGC